LSALREYRRVAAAWPEETRRLPSWTVHQSLAGHPERTEILDELCRNQATPDEARRLMGLDD
jgi:hypothetical protein